MHTGVEVSDHSNPLHVHIPRSLTVEKGKKNIDRFQKWIQTNLMDSTDSYVVGCISLPSQFSSNSYVRFVDNYVAIWNQLLAHGSFESKRDDTDIDVLKQYLPIFRDLLDLFLRKEIITLVALLTIYTLIINAVVTTRSKDLNTFERVQVNVG